MFPLILAAQALGASLAFILLGLGAAQHKTNIYENTFPDALEGNQPYKSRSMNDHRPCQRMSMSPSRAQIDSLKCSIDLF